jgi:hypothetical protein
MGFRRGDAACLNEQQQVCPTLPQIPAVQTPSCASLLVEPQTSPVGNLDTPHSVIASGTLSVPETKLSPPVIPKVTDPGSRIPDQPQAARDPFAKFRNYTAIPMNTNSRAQARDLYAAYPHPPNSDTETTDVLPEMQAIHRALAKITYAELIPIVKRFAAWQIRLGAGPKLTPPLVKWFDEEHWKQG